MKTKKLSKKLELNKITVAQLNKRDISKVKGGSGDSCSLIICFSCIEIQCGGSGGSYDCEELTHYQ